MKKVLSLFLVLSIMMTVVGTMGTISVSAAATVVEVSTEAELRAAIDAASTISEEPTTIKLLNDIEITNTSVNNGNFVIEGKYITFTGGYDIIKAHTGVSRLDWGGAHQKALINVKGGSVTFDGVGIDMNIEDTRSNGGRALHITSRGAVEIYNAEVKNGGFTEGFGGNAQLPSANGYGMAVWMEGNTSFTLGEGAKITGFVANASVNTCTLIHSQQNAYTIIEGGEISGNTIKTDYGLIGSGPAYYRLRSGKIVDNTNLNITDGSMYCALYSTSNNSEGNFYMSGNIEIDGYIQTEGTSKRPGITSALQYPLTFKSTNRTSNKVSEKATSETHEGYYGRDLAWGSGYVLTAEDLAKISYIDDTMKVYIDKTNNSGVQNGGYVYFQDADKIYWPIKSLGGITGDPGIVVPSDFSEYEVTFLNANGGVIAKVPTEWQLVTPPTNVTVPAGMVHAGWRAEDGTLIKDFSAVLISEDSTFTIEIWEQTEVYITPESTDNTVTVDTRYFKYIDECVLLEYNADGTLNNMVILTEEPDVADGGLSDRFNGKVVFKTTVDDVTDKTYRAIMLSEGIPVSAPWKYDGTETRIESAITEYDSRTRVTYESGIVNAQAKTITIKGSYKANNTIYVKLMLGRYIKIYDSAVCDKDGNFTFVYDYSADYATLGANDVYIPSFYQEWSELTSRPRDISIKPVTLEEYNEVIAELGGIADGEGLVEYAEENADKLLIIGIDVNDGYEKLSDANKVAIMTEILPLIQNEDATAEEVFNNGVTVKLQEQAISEIADATVNTVGGILTKYNEVLFSTELWTTYNNNSSKWEKILKNFLGYDKDSSTTNNNDSVENIAENLGNAITKANQTTTGGGGGGGGGSRDDKKEADESFYQAPKEPVEVYKPITPKTFSDVDTTHWAYEPITILATRGVVNGMGDGSYGPEIDLTREAFVKMIVEALGFTSNGRALAFSDVDSTAWYSNSINIASGIGLVEGYDGKFGIGDGLTREQMATMLYRAADIAGIKLEDKVDAKTFTDSDEIGDYAVEAVKELCEAGILNGMDNGSYSPKTICNRAMAAKVLYQILALQ